jgi:hypothetical protein
MSLHAEFEDPLEQPPSMEVVHWFDRPGWSFGALPPGAALAGAFVLGAATALAAFFAYRAAREQLW